MRPSGIESADEKVSVGAPVGGARRRTVGRASLLLGVFLTAGLLLGACGQEGPSILDPQGPRSERIADLWWVLFALGTAVFVVVIALVLLAIFRGQPGPRPDPSSNGWFAGTTFVGIAGFAIPLVILAAVFGFTLWTLSALADPDEPTSLTIEVLGHQWWWEVHYPEEGVVTANEIHIPAGQPVELKLTAPDVIHSLWVPELSGKTDLIPGKTNTMWLEANEPGEYRGQCAEFCGIQHANMAFLVIAQPPDEFAAWIAEQREPADEPAVGSIIQRGQQIFLGSACVYCHTVNGTNASGRLGPDLTHLASRQTLAAGTIENNLGNLSGWVVDPQAIKPGNKMPATNLTAEELQALMAYLMSLR